MQRLFLTVLLAASPALTQAQNLYLNWDWAVSESQKQFTSSAFIEPNTEQRFQLDALLDVEFAYQNWSGIGTLYSQDIYQSDNHTWFEESESQLIVRELAWQGSVELGTQSYDLSLGKIRLDYGVSYAYRPLDMFKPYRQNPIGLSVEEGAMVAALSSFDASGEWSLLYTNSHWTDNKVEQFDQANQQQGVGMRRYQLHGAHEYQFIGYYDDVRRGAIGASWVTVPLPAWEFHTEALWQKQSMQFTQPIQLFAPVELAQAGEAWQALAGFTYTAISGHSFIGEYWYDSRAWSDSEWQNAIEQGQGLKNSAQTYAIATSYAQGLSHYNLTQHNVMLHWRWDSQTWLQWQTDGAWSWLGDVTPKLDLLISPQDGGVVATQWITYQWIDNGDLSIDLEFTARFLSGKNESAYAQVNQSHTLTFTIKGKF
ncbi:hypothetical protein BIY21_00110 [Vibrio ponticus]|uniref:Beta-lactamase n=1 Tax=Vibrio ponticus TaxID=265668 RepID=A0ABX3FMK8_9VIBR|nr:hypothetical protein [Vibrio ponticus]OLQ94237.1 hypothetical protein BIY21_00110 [Vibrio ponticus]